MQTPVPPRAMPAHPHHPQPAPAGAEVDHWLAATLRALELLLWPVKAIVRNGLRPAFAVAG